MIVRVDALGILLEARRYLVAEVLGGFFGQAALGRWWLPCAMLGEGDAPAAGDGLLAPPDGGTARPDRPVAPGRHRGARVALRAAEGLEHRSVRNPWNGDRLEDAHEAFPPPRPSTPRRTVSVRVERRPRSGRSRNAPSSTPALRSGRAEVLITTALSNRSVF